MRILHLSSESTWRGGEQQIAYLVSELADLGIEPLVACRPESAFESHCAQMGWKHFPLSMSSSLDLQSARKLKKLCQNLSIDLIHAHSSHGHGTAFLAYLLGNKTPVLLTRRVDFEVGKNWFSKYKYTFPKLEKIVCVSDAIRKIVIEGTNQPESCSTVYSSINHERFRAHIGGSFLRDQFQLDATTTLIGNTSAIAPHKDYFTFAKAAEYYVRNFDQNVRFFVIGKGEQEAELKTYVKQQNLDNYFIFTGFLKNIEEVLPSLDIFFISSKTEGLGTSVIDAFASKVPVVATRAGGIPELISHLKTGLLSEVGDFTDLAENIAKLRTEPELRNQIVENAYQKSLRFNTKTMASKYLEIYKKFISKREAPLG